MGLVTRKTILNINYEPIIQYNFLSSYITEKAISILQNKKASGNVTGLGSYKVSVSRPGSGPR